MTKLNLPQVEFVVILHYLDGAYAHHFALDMETAQLMLRDYALDTSIRELGIFDFASHRVLKDREGDPTTFHGKAVEPTTPDAPISRSDVANFDATRAAFERRNDPPIHTLPGNNSPFAEICDCDECKTDPASRYNTERAMYFGRIIDDLPDNPVRR